VNVGGLLIDIAEPDRQVAAIEVGRYRNNETRRGFERQPRWGVAQQNTGLFERKIRTAQRNPAALDRAGWRDRADCGQRSGLV
jgi:hypothetical protein